VGGDFYDVVQTGPATWLVVLGDVSGKGIPAATVTSFVRYTVRTLALDFPDPAELLGELDLALRAHPTDRFCTLVLARLCRVDGLWEIEVSLAGHPPAILRTPAGEVRELGLPGTPTGLVDRPHFHTVHHRLTDETLTLYTDGVTEARGADGMYGDERLHTLVASLPHDPQAITDGITRAALDFQGGITADDIAVVTIAAT
jgi:sigma-B regulation protein RsbU (phosphoserine phosphatase)